MMLPLSALLLLLPSALAGADIAAPPPTLVEHPIASGSTPVYLDGSAWTATNAGWAPAAEVPLPATVPGDIITDLQRAKRVQDPYYNVTWRDPAFISAWHDGTWTYSKTFPTTSAMLAPAAAETLLVMDGVRMGATVTLNGHVLGNITDQFLRYEYPVCKLLLPVSGKANALSVTFDKMIPTGGRSTYSNQIDWAPVFATTDPTSGTAPDAQRIPGRETFGFGIWKSVYLLPVAPKAVAITQLVLHTFYAGGHPICILSDTTHEGFELRARVVMWAPTATTGHVTVALPDLSGATVTVQASVNEGYSNISVIVPAAGAIFD